MESNESPEKEALIEQIVTLLVKEQMTEEDVIDQLVADGLDRTEAETWVGALSLQIAEHRKKQGRNQMLEGAAWAIGGTVATLAEIGYIFWGAILYGVIKFIQGAVKA